MTDVETLETRGDFRVRLVTDDYPENPRKDYDHITHVITVQNNRYADVDDDGGPLAKHWARLISGHGWRTPDTRDAVAMFERFAKIHGIVTLYDTPNDGASAIWYMMPDQYHEVGDPMAYLTGERDEYRAWANGEVYGYVIEQRVKWHHTDHDSDDEMATWDHVESCYGFIGYQYAEQEARDAFASFAEVNATNQPDA